jgi:hypothetical protein
MCHSFSSFFGFVILHIQSHICRLRPQSFYLLDWNLKYASKCSVYQWDRVLLTFCPAWLWISILPINVCFSSSWNYSCEPLNVISFIYLIWRLTVKTVKIITAIITWWGKSNIKCKLWNQNSNYVRGNFHFDAWFLL